MKQLEVIVKDKNTLILSEDGMKGDQINLAELANVDLTAIEEIIDEGRDQVYLKKINELKLTLENEHKQSLEIQRLALIRKHDEEVNTLKDTISNYDTNKTLEIERIQSENNLEVERLKALLKRMEETQQQTIENEKLQLEKKYLEEINKLKQQLTLIKPEYELEIERIKSDYETKINTINLEHSEEINKKNEVINQYSLYLYFHIFYRNDVITQETFF